MTQTTVEPLPQYSKGAMRVSLPSVRFVQTAVLSAVSGCGFGRILCFAVGLWVRSRAVQRSAPPPHLPPVSGLEGRKTLGAGTAPSQLVDHDTKLEESRAKSFQSGKREPIALAINRRTLSDAPVDAGNEARALNQEL
ncbi:hypothetical protein BDW67DRAFT_8201 [Aspergillus spinulosporus]